MASFVVDFTEVKFAATNTGYKDITITGMPQAGVTCTIEGTDASSFGFRIPGSDQNVYRVYTTSNTNIGTSVNEKTATFKITNLSDSTDYVDVSLIQVLYPGKPVVRGVENVYDNVYARYAGDSFGDADVFAEYRTDDVGTYAILYVDGYEGTTTLSQTWAYYTAESAYTDTGFKQVKIGASNNYDTAFRYCNITFPGTGGTYNTSKLYQNAYPGNTSGCTSPTLYTKDGGTERVTLNHSSQNVSNLSAITYYTEDGLTYRITKTAASNYKTYWDITVGPNTSDKILRGAILFERSATHTLFGFTLVRQDAASGPAQTLTADPAVLDYPASGGGKTLDVTYATSLSTNESSFPSWLGATYVSVGSSARSYTITAASNTSTSSRSFDFELADANMSLTVPITQAGGTPVSLSISPTSDSVGSLSGSVQITVTSSGISDLSYTISDSWITSAGAPVGGVYTFTYAEKTSSGQRTGTITFYGGGLSETYTLIQAGASQVIVSPTSESVGSASGSRTVNVSGPSSSSISYSVSSDAQSWLSVTGSGGSYSVSYTENTGSSSRTGVVTFSADGYISGTYTLTQDAAVAEVITLSKTSDSVSSSSGTTSVTATGASNIQVNVSESWMTYSVSGSTYTFSYSANTGSSSRTATATFTAPGATSATYTLTQAAPAASLSISPTSKSVSGASGRVDITVNATGISDLQYTFSSEGVFVFSHTEGNVYVFSYFNNTSSTTGRAAMIYFSGGGLTKIFTLNQDAGSTTVFNLIPTSDSVDGGSGYVYVTISEDNVSHSSINRSIDVSWLSYVSSAGMIDKYMYRANPTGNPRTATVTYTANGVSPKTYTLVQSAGSSPADTGSLKAYPKKLRYYKEGGSLSVSFTNRPAAGIGYQITYTEGSGWLTVSGNSVTAVANSGIRRRASIKFYDLGDSNNYVIIPVIQGSVDGYDSIWVDQMFYPEDRDENGNYYYRLFNQDDGFEYFTGVSTEPEGFGNLGIDIPRLVEGHLHTDFIASGTGLGWSDMHFSYATVDVYNMTDTGWPGVVDATFKYCNDWSRIEKRYDYTKSLNDPINFKGTDNMVIPFCVYYDDAATFSAVETERNGSVNTYTYTTPENPFSMRYDMYYDTKRVDYMQDGDILFSYDLDHCGPGAFIYRNRFGGWDSFLIEGNVIKTDNYTRQNWRRKGFYNQTIDVDSYGYNAAEKVTDSIDINTTYEAHTGWLTDEESARLVFHLLSSPTVYYQILKPEETNTDAQLFMFPVRLTSSSAEYKKFRNGKRLVNYLITFEKGNIEKVMR